MYDPIGVSHANRIVKTLAPKLHNHKKSVIVAVEWMQVKYSLYLESAQKSP